MKKRILSMILVCCIFVSVMPIAEANETANWIEVNGIEGGKIDFDESTGMIIECEQTVTSAIIPATINGINVTAIDYGAFSDCKELTEIIVPDGVTEIGYGAFRRCENLSKVVLPESLSDLGWADSFYWPNSGVFTDCKKLISAGPIGSGCNIEFAWKTTIPNSAFRHCNSLQSVVIPEGVIGIGEVVFADCDNLTDIALPETLESIGIGAFADSGIYNDQANWDDGILYVDNWIVAVDENIAGEHVIKDGTKGFVDYSFKSRQNLTGITIPDSVEYMGFQPFTYCRSLERVTLSSNASYIGKNAFEDAALTSLTIPEGVTHIDKYAFGSCTHLTGDLIIPDSVIFIDDDAFYRCKFSGNLIIGDGLTKLPTVHSALFTGNLIIGDGILEIPKNAFSSSQFSGNLVIGQNVSSIGNYAFSNSDFSSITMPGSVTSVGYDAFANCSKVKSAGPIGSDCDYEFGWNQEIPSSAFSGCSGLTMVTIPDGIKTIGNNAFSGCSSLDCVMFPQGTERIEYGAFSKCSSLSYVVIPTSLNYIGAGAFDNGCDKLTDIYYAGSKAEWKKIEIKDANIGDGIEPFESVTIHYDSMGPDENQNAWGSVRYFSEWDAENQIAYFDDDNLHLGCEVVDETDTGFLDDVEKLVGTYVVAEIGFRDDNFVGPYKLLSLKPTEAIVGTVTSATIEGTVLSYLTSVSIDDTSYSVMSGAIINPGDLKNKLAICFLCEGQVAGLDILKLNTGYLTAWDEVSREVTIDDQQYPTNYISDLSFVDKIEEWRDTAIYYYQGEPVSSDSAAPIIKIAEMPEEYYIRAYAKTRDLSVGKGQSIDIICTLFRAGEIVKNWDTPAIAIDNNQIISISDYSSANGEYRFTVTGVEDGQVHLTVSDTESGANVMLPITVAEKEVIPFSYSFDTVPKFYPSAFGDTKILTNFYDVNGLYVKDFSYTAGDDNYSVSFDVYNHNYLYGAVDVYDETGKWVASEKISKYSEISGIYETGEAAVYLVKDGIIDRNLLSYTAHTYSKKTSINITVPKNGYFTISNNYTQSPGTYLYNTLDFMMLGVNAICDLATGSIKSETVMDGAIDMMFLSEEEYFKKYGVHQLTESHLQSIFMSKFKSIAMKSMQTTSELAVGEMFGAITTDGEALLKSAGLDWKELVKNTIGIDESAFAKVTGPIGATMKGLFSFNKYLSYGMQTVSICASRDKQYITIHTPTDAGSMTVNGVTVIPGESSLDEKAVLQVFRIVEDDSLEEMISQDAKCQLYNICLVKDDSTVQPNGKVTVRIPIPVDYNENSSKIYRQEQDGSWTALDAYTEGAYLVFETTHFSLYAIVDTSFSLDGNDSALHASCICRNSILSAPVTIQNAGTEVHKDTVILAIYSDFGKLLEAEMRTLEIDEGAEISDTLTVDCSQYEDWATVKLFWLDASTLCARAACKSIDYSAK